jgi:cytochrome b
MALRLFHWMLVISFALAAYTGFLGRRNLLDFHIIGGAMAGALVAFRVIWGWLGPTYARFSSFPLSPRAMRQHLDEIFAEYRDGKTHRHMTVLGHNPLGAAMVYALLLFIALTVLSGVVLLGGAVKQGPLAFLVTWDTASLARNIHQALAIALLCMVGAHLVGVIFESRRESINLAAAMVTGRKPASKDGKAIASLRARPWLAAVILIVLASAIVPATIALARLPALGVPPAKLDPVYAQECGACHIAYAPSLAPSDSWEQLMDGLAHHFGENATLDAATAAHIRAYLADNSAEKWDTRPAHLFRQRDAADPLSITATPGWQRFHRDLPAALFASKQIGGKGACNACHQDAASGRFDPQAIEIPEGAEP